jgi:integrase
MGCGVPATPTGKALAKQKAASIELDISAGYFDPTLCKPLDDHNFNRTAWKAILQSVGVEYHSPYAIRHSAISHALANGANLMDLAEQTGHDKRVFVGYLFSAGNVFLKKYGNWERFGWGFGWLIVRSPQG